MKPTKAVLSVRKEVASAAHKIPKHKPKIGIVLGSGSARGWAHIGVLKCLEQHNIIPEVICGTSIGALVGGAYAAGQIKALESFATSITWKNYLEFIDFKMSLSGIFSGERIVTLMQQEAKETIMIENLPKPFACVATDLRTGKEIWLKKGSLFHAIRASAAIPLIFDPVKDEERSTKHRTEWLVDGAVVNPLPISLCRALGADVVIAVNLNRDILVRNFAKMKSGSLEKAFLSSLNPIPQTVHDTASSLVEYLSKAKYYFSSSKEKVPMETSVTEPVTEEESNVYPPNMVKVITTAINIMQQRIMTSRIAGDPPEIELNPKLTDMDTFDFHKGQYAIQCGEECVKQMIPMIQETIKRFH